MPYIETKRKEQIDEGSFLATAGELNYSITMILLWYMETKGLSYQTINDIIGALEGAKAEFQRRVVVPYEDEKIKKNGDVYSVLTAVK